MYPVIKNPSAKVLIGYLAKFIRFLSPPATADIRRTDDIKPTPILAENKPAGLSLKYACTAALLVNLSTDRTDTVAKADSVAARSIGYWAA